MTGIFVLPLLFVLFFINGVYRIRDYERFAVFRAGRFFRVMGPGWVFLIPLVDKKKRINLNRHIPGWNRMSREELAVKVRAFALETMPRNRARNPQRGIK
jgi:regulator of protease activity HflC (stomatin/prohibitin superfamily)